MSIGWNNKYSKYLIVTKRTNATILTILFSIGLEYLIFTNGVVFWKLSQLIYAAISKRLSSENLSLVKIFVFKIYHFSLQVAGRVMDKAYGR